MKRLDFMKLLAAGAIMSLGAGCGSNTATNNAGSDTNSGTANAANTSADATNTAEGGSNTIRIAYSPNIVLPQPILLKSNPAYAKLGPDLKFEFKEYPAGPAVIEALRAGSVDVGYSGVFPPLKAYLKNGDIQLVAGAATGGTELVVAKDSPYKTVKDLKGKSVGVNQLGSTVDAMVRGAILDAGLIPDTDIKIKPIEPAQQADALKSGTVAAVAAPAPWPSQVELSGGRPLLDWKAIFDKGNYSAGVFFTSKKFADANPALLKKYAALHRAITDKLNANRETGNADVLAAWSTASRKKLSPEVAKAAFTTIKFTNDPDPAGVDRMADLAVKTGISKKKGDLSGFIVKTD